MSFFELPHLSKPVSIEQDVSQALGIDVYATLDLCLCQLVGGTACGVHDGAAFCGQPTNEFIERQQPFRTQNGLRRRLDGEIGAWW